MARSPRLCIHGTRPSGLTTLRFHAEPLAHSHYTAISAHPVLEGPTRNVTHEAMPTLLDDALTQLPFLEFAQRRNLLNWSFSTISVTSPNFIRGRCYANCRTLCDLSRFFHPKLRVCPSPPHLLMWQCKRRLSVPPSTHPARCQRHHGHWFFHVN